MMKSLTAFLAILVIASTSFADRLSDTSTSTTEKTRTRSDDLVGNPTEAGIPIFVDLTGIISFDGEGAAGNTVLSVPVGAPGTIINGIGWDTVQTAGDPPFVDAPISWLSEMTIGLDYEQDGFNDLFITPGVGDDFPGTASYSSGGILKLVDAMIPEGVATTGSIDIEFFESFVDTPGAAEGIYEQGTLTIQIVPEPTTLVLLLAAGLGLFFRRR
jgi:hypothetical protein